MSIEHQDYCNENYGPEDAPTREEQEGDAWEYWHQRAIKFEAEIAVLRSALVHVRKIIVEGAETGFNCRDGDWADRLFASQAMTHSALTSQHHGKGD